MFVRSVVLQSMSRKEEDIVFKPSVDVRQIWNKELDHSHYRFIIFLFIALMLLSIIIGGIGFGTFQIMGKNSTATTTNMNEYDCGHSDGDGLCECISNYHTGGAIPTFHYEWKVVDTCDDTLPCAKGLLFKTHDISNSAENSMYQIGNVYPCSANNQCNRFYR